MANYIFTTDDTNDSFQFQIGKLKFNFRYPTTKEIREINTIGEETRRLVEEKADKELIEAKVKESEEKMNALVTPVGHENQIGEVLDNVGVNIVREVRAMMAKEISLE